MRSAGRADRRRERCGFEAERQTGVVSSSGILLTVMYERQLLTREFDDVVEESEDRLTGLLRKLHHCITVAERDGLSATIEMEAVVRSKVDLFERLRHLIEDFGIPTFIIVH